jgi:hypothetical protein
MEDTTSKWEDELERWLEPFLDCLARSQGAAADVSALCRGTDWTR